ncbi:threonine/homoserine/homoserine lactone efflux protein [Collimonas sp. PA-H2]|uniref:LysE family translocator n=1 Tax=Collimonas sp. PA-H2 TaxID=1881062 RepID=UPI000BF7DA22|nr:LysE family transporter [Collimonas sp. PA-H2]PFH10770.1 threonine/homoserine/homoserine lactone efflux protein [Collimonas sp. PA-H2]
MDVALFLKAALIGLSIAAPVGPVGLLCIQRTIAHGPRIGFASGLGAATADATYGAIGAFGLATVTNYFVTLTTPLALFGALFLGWMGIKLLRAAPPAGAASAANGVFAGKAFVSVFILTLANPMTILSFIAVFAAIAGPAANAPSAARIMVLGVFCGSAFWWLLLACGVATVRHKIGPGTMTLINRIGGCILLGFAGWQLVRIAG